jgi:hypothetical protein
MFGERHVKHKIIEKEFFILYISNYKLVTTSSNFDFIDLQHDYFIKKDLK